jgi:hypothetical protein
MNERIRQLAEQAITEKLSLEEFIEALKLEPHDFYGFRKSELEKFADLIVQECIETLRLVPYNSDREFGDEVIYQDAVKKHFGVEE